jgi:hypothetical protein
MALTINGYPLTHGMTLPLPSVRKGEHLEFEMELTEDATMELNEVKLCLTAELGGNPLELDFDTLIFTESPKQITVKSKDPISNEGIITVKVEILEAPLGGALRQRMELKSVAVEPETAPAPATPDDLTSEPAPKQGLSDFAKGAMIWAAILFTLLLIPTTWFGFKGISGAGRMIGETFDASIENIFVEGDEVHIDNAGKTKVLPTEKAEEPAI